MRAALTALLLTFASQAALAEKIFVDGNILVYNTESAENETGISLNDVAAFNEILKLNKNITVVHLTSSGGEVDAAYQIADIILKRELDTHAVDYCESACSIILLAGVDRTASNLAKIGFHQTSITPEGAQSEYNELKDEMDFKVLFDYASWLLKDTQDLILNHMHYYKDVGLSLEFVIKTLEAYSDEMWYPRHTYTVSEGVLTR